MSGAIQARAVLYIIICLDYINYLLISFHNSSERTSSHNFEKIKFTMQSFNLTHVERLENVFFQKFLLFRSSKRIPAPTLCLWILQTDGLETQFGSSKPAPNLICTKIIFKIRPGEYLIRLSRWQLFLTHVLI